MVRIIRNDLLGHIKVFITSSCHGLTSEEFCQGIQQIRKGSKYFKDKFPQCHAWHKTMIREANIRSSYAQFSV